MAIERHKRLFNRRNRRIRLIKRFVRKSSVQKNTLALRWVRDLVAIASESELTELVFLARTLEHEMKQKYGNWIAR